LWAGVPTIERSACSRQSANHAQDSYSTITGGQGNKAWDIYATVGGGVNNKASGYASVIAGGQENYADGQYSAILGGYRDSITNTANFSCLFGIDSKLTEDSTFMVDMPHIHFGDENDGYEFPATDGSNGQVMATDGNGQLNWTPITSASGWTDDGTRVRLTDSTDWVGIGTSAPGSRFHVLNTISGAAGLFTIDNASNEVSAVYGYTNGTGPGVLGVNNRDMTSGYLGGNGIGVYGQSSVSWAGFFNGDAHVSGKVGIGTENPKAMLEVSGLARIQRSGWPAAGEGMELAYDSTLDRGYIQVFDRNAQTWGSLFLGNGNVGINKIDPQDKLEVKGNIRLDGGIGGGATLRFAEGGTLRWALLYRPWASDKIGFHDEVNNSWTLMMDPNNGGRVGINTPDPNYTLDVRGVIGNNGTVYHSDRRWKQNVRTITKALDKVTNLRGVHYEWKRDEFAEMNFPAGSQLGIVAQEVEDVLPELVHTGADGYKSVDYSKLTAVLIEAVKELKAENETLVERVEELEHRLPK
jgi:hypothetical protein